MKNEVVKFISVKVRKLQIYLFGQPWGIQFTQHFFSQPVYFTNIRRNEPLYIDNLISFNNKRFKELNSDICPKELTISETTESTSVASFSRPTFYWRREQQHCHQII